jgi:hypothetical protein
MKRVRLPPDGGLYGGLHPGVRSGRVLAREADGAFPLLQDVLQLLILTKISSRLKKTETVTNLHLFLKISISKKIIVLSIFQDFGVNRRFPRPFCSKKYKF